MTTLEIIRKKVRSVTGRQSPNQLSNEDIDDYINTFYQYDLPEHLRLSNLKKTYSFITEPNVDIYNFTPNTNVSVEGPIYVSGYPAQLYQSRDAFFQVFSERSNIQRLTTGDGGSGPYSGTITSVPVKRGSRVLLSTIDNAGNSLTAEDDGIGSFTGDLVAGSTIDYISGAISGLNWNANITVGTEIRVQSIQYSATRPYAVLFFADQFQLNPVPDQAYKIEMTTYITPTALANSSDSPLLNEWWQLLAYGACLKVFADNLDMESYSKVQPLFDEQKRLVLRRKLKQVSLNRAQTIYSDNNVFVNPYPTNNV